METFISPLLDYRYENFRKKCQNVAQHTHTHRERITSYILLSSNLHILPKLVRIRMQLLNGIRDPCAQTLLSPIQHTAHAKSDAHSDDAQTNKHA